MGGLVCSGYDSTAVVFDLMQWAGILDGPCRMISAWDERDKAMYLNG